MAQGIIINGRQRPALTGSTLIKQNNPKPLRVEKTPQCRRATATGATMQHHHGNALRITTLFHI